MKKALLLMALFAGSLLSANADDHLTALLKPGNAVLGIQLKNATEYTAFQMDITLPDGMTLDVADGEDASSAVTLQRQDANGTQQVHANFQDGVLKVAAFSYKDDNGTIRGNQSFTGEKGDMLLVKVKVADGCVASDVNISNVEFVKTDGLVAKTDVGLTAKGKLGDINGNNEVTTDDAVMAIRHFLNKTTLTSEQIEAGDVTGDLVVTTDDAVNIIKIFLNKY